MVRADGGYAGPDTGPPRRVSWPAADRITPPDKAATDAMRDPL